MAFGLPQPAFDNANLMLTQEDMVHFLMMQGLFEVELNVPSEQSKEMKRLKKLARKFVNLERRRPNRTRKRDTIFFAFSRSILKRQDHILIEPERVALERFIRAIAYAPSHIDDVRDYASGRL